MQTPSASDDNPKLKKQRKKWLSILAIVVVIIAIGVFIWYWLYGRWYEYTDDAYVDGNLVQITPLINGVVININADDGDLVLQGQTLVELDPSDTEIALQQATANLANTVRKVRSLYRMVDSYKAQLQNSKITLQKAQEDFKRRKELISQGAISREVFAHTKSALETAQSNVIDAEQLLQSNFVLVENTNLRNHPDVLAAKAQFRQAYLDHLRTKLIAPVTGYVAKRTVQVGQYIETDTPLMAVVPLNQVWVNANFKETQLQYVRINQPVKLESDLYGSNVVYHGRVESLGVGTGSAFALLPAQNATGNWIKIVQRLPVRIKLDPQDLEKYPLRIGLSMAATINLHDQSGNVLPTIPSQHPILSTDIYHQQLAEATDLINTIIDQNAGNESDQNSLSK